MLHCYVGIDPLDGCFFGCTSVLISLEYTVGWKDTVSRVITSDTWQQAITLAIACSAGSVQSLRALIPIYQRSSGGLVGRKHVRRRNYSIVRNECALPVVPSAA